MEKRFLFIISILILCITGCKSTQLVTATISDYAPTCIGTEHDGSITVKSWGVGKNENDANEQAGKNAVVQTLFKGFFDQEFKIRPLVNEANAREKYSKYFDNMLKDGGKYKSFVSKKDQKRGSTYGVENNESVGLFVILRVDRAALEKQLIKDDILDKSKKSR